MPLGKMVGLGPGHIVLDRDPVPTAAPPHFRPMPIVAKRSPISATAELLLLLATFAICCRPSVCPHVTLLHRTQTVVNFSTAFGTLAIRWHPRKILRKSSQGNTSAGVVKHKRGSQI